MVVVTLNLKGGTGKTTTAVYLAAALSRLAPTLLVDADPQGSALSWAEQAGLDCVALPVRDMARRLPPLMGNFAHAVIDTPPSDPAIVRSALAAADLAAVPTTPALLDLDRLSPTINLVAEFPELPASVVLVKVFARSRSAGAAREVLPEYGVPLLDAQVPHRVAIADAFGTDLRGQDLGPYEAVAAELGLLEMAS